VRYLVTGHTGFKGAWLVLGLVAQGHEVHGLALDPAPGSLYERARVTELLARDLRVDVRDAAAVREAVVGAAPDVVLHLAAQPLVRESYRAPRFTVETNVLGTYNVLEAAQTTGTVRAQVVVTTDKVYRDAGQARGYREDDPLGGRDPYSASKAAADIVAQSWMASTPGAVPTAIARAGNVVGGGDVCADRLVVDLVAGFSAGVRPQLRNPRAIRPWQHVLDCLHGYLVLVDALLDGRAAGEAYNFGPPPASAVPVGAVASKVAALWEGDVAWQQDGRSDHPVETATLTLDAAKAEDDLGWRNLLDLDETLAWTVDWARRTAAGEPARDVSLEQVLAFAERAARVAAVA
jgi:CDP-glucose 4,6-dehydratase